MQDGIQRRKEITWLSLLYHSVSSCLYVSEYCDVLVVLTIYCLPFTRFHGSSRESVI